MTEFRYTPEELVYYTNLATENWDKLPNFLKKKFQSIGIFPGNEDAFLQSISTEN